MPHDIFALCDLVRETSFALHRYLRHGHTEKIYENGLSSRLRKRGIRLEQQSPLSVTDEDGTILGEMFSDMLIDRCLIVEIKACRALLPDHVAQLLGYLRASRIPHGMLINFGARRLEIKKYILSDH